uniref:SH2 domain-containing protein n=1 Tax=Malurus cyaneus samueli TaxID=2593467 RepID=A0A8C5X601_9PASS
MGNLPSRVKPLSIPAASVNISQPPLLCTPDQCPASGATVMASILCIFPASCSLSPSGWLISLPHRDGEWWLVASKVSGKECYIPSSCVAKIRHGWLYEGVSRQKAEELLLHPGNDSGSFLIRESQSRQGCYSLSVRHGNNAASASVTHYRIHRLDNGWLYISARLTFPSLHNLVEHYSEFSEGLCCCLSQPCCTGGPRAAPNPTTPAVVRNPSLHWDKIESSLLFSETTSPPEESLISQGLREAISSYLLLSERSEETDTPELEPTGKAVKNS